MDRRNNEPALCMNPGKKKSNTYRVKNERFAAPGEYLPKKMRKVIEVLLRGRKKRTKHRKWREKKKETKKYLIRREIMRMLLIR